MNQPTQPRSLRNALIIAATSLALLVTGCGSDPVATKADPNAPTIEAATQTPLPGGKGAPKNGGGIVYHSSDCGSDYVRWYGFGGDGKGQPCDTWGLEPFKIDVIHSADWNFTAEDLNRLAFIRAGWAVLRETDLFTPVVFFPEEQKQAIWAIENRFFDEVNSANGGRAESRQTLRNRHLPGGPLPEGKSRLGVS
jgi:hypothetical protein